MKKSAFLALVCCLIATGLARPPVYLGYQDSLGQYSFGYSAPGSARSEVRTSNGATRGTYSYVDETGAIQTAQYVADGENGFRVIATNLPQAPLPVQDTPEVMAARTAHLQALEMATKRDEAEAQSHGKNLEDARRRKIEGGQIDQMTPETDEEQTGAKSTESESKDEEKKRKAVEGTVRNVDPTKDPGQKSPPSEAVVSRGDVDRKGEKSPQGIHEESSGRTTQEMIGDSGIPAISLISSRVLLRQAAYQHAVPVFRISYGNHEIEPPTVPESSIVQGVPGAITPSGMALKIGPGAISTRNTAAPGREQTPSRDPKEQADILVNTLVNTPSSVIPLSSSYSSFVGYIVSSAPPHYAAYNVL